MTDPTLTAAAVLAARWRPMDEVPGAVLAELGDRIGLPAVLAVDGQRFLDLSDEDVSAIAEHLCDTHNATLWKSTDKLAGVLSEVEADLAAHAMHVMSAVTLVNAVENEACELSVDDTLAFRKRDPAAMRAARKGPIRARAIQVAALAVALAVAIDREAAQQEEAPAHG